MVQIAGKYQVAENKNFYEFLIASGVPEENAKRGETLKSTLEFQVDGNKVRLVAGAELANQVNELVLNQEVDETFPIGGPLKSTATLNGNVLTIKSKGGDGSTLLRVYTFSDAGFEVVMTFSKGGASTTTTRIYKRL